MVKTWRIVLGYPDYKVSDCGRVRSVDRLRPHYRSGFIRIKGRELKLHRHRQGYLQVRLPSGLQFVHKLVLEAFIGARPEWYEAAHLNGDNTDNRLVNLAWVTHLENMRQQKEHGTGNIGEQSPRAILTEKDVIWIRTIGAGLTQKDIASKFNVTRSTARSALQGDSWRHLNGDFPPKRKTFRGRNLQLATLDDQDIAILRDMHGLFPPAVWARTLGVSKTTVKRHIDSFSGVQQP